MNFLKNMQQRDWTIAFVAFILGAVVF